MRKLFPHIQAILLVYIVTIVSMALNIPIVRQVSVFVYLIFIPGFAILKILKLGERDVTFTVLFSAGLSIVFLMFVGLVINELYPLLGVSKPLSVVPLTMTLMGLTVILLLVGYKSNSARAVNIDFLVHITRKTLFKALVFVFPPVLGIIGALYDYTPALIIMIVVVATLVLAGFSRRFLPQELYPLAIFAIGLGLLLHITLISRYNFGYDINTEYYVFKLTQIQAHWDKPGTVLSASQVANFQSDLGVTILPTIYAVLINISGELTFKLVFGFIFSLVPLVLYRIFEVQTGKTFAFLSAFVFMLTPFGFYGSEPLGLNRQMLAELFFVLSVFLLVDKSIGLRKRTVLFLIFSFGVVVSHYSTSYIYLLFVAFTFILSYTRARNGGVLTKEVVLFVFAMTFSWYIYISNSAFLGLTDAIRNMITSFSSDLFSTSARSTYAYTMLNPSTSSSIVGLIHRLLVYCQNGLILIGVSMLFIRKKETPFSREYRFISFISMFLLVMGLAVPNFAPTLNFQRFYQYTLLFLAPFFVFGGLAIIEFIENLSSHLSSFRMPILEKLRPAIPRNLSLQLLTLLLITSFLFQVGLVSHVTRSAPISTSLDLDRKKTSNDLAVLESLYELYIPEQDVFSAEWYLRNIGQEPEVYADVQSKDNVLPAYALENKNKIRYISNTTVLQRSAYVYLRYFNIRHNTIVSYQGRFNTSNVDVLNQTDTIYSNGASEIRWTP